jgi:hypothetical protein
MDLRQLGQSRQFGLSGIACKKRLVAAVLRCRDVNTIPRPRRTVQCMAGAQLISPVSEVLANDHLFTRFKKIVGGWGYWTW